MSDLIIDLGAKGANKLLQVPLKKAAIYYETHIDLLKDALKTLLKGNEIKAQVAKLEANTFEIKRSAAELSTEIPKKPEPPKKDGKSWGKSKKHTSYKAAMEAYVEGITLVIVTLEDYIKTAEAAQKTIAKAMQDFQDAAQEAQQQKGTWAKLLTVSHLDALQTMITNDAATQTAISKVIADKQAVLSAYKKALGPAMKEANAAK
ncbi:MAG: hypothetical protein KF887_10000 [Paracoccaceae bacterium]|nr:MAG: hypothetical protein KF887_10000 [Paracoccaceae bacterium]